MENKMYKSIGMGIVVSIVILFLINYEPQLYDKAIVGLLSLIAVGLFGLILKMEDKEKSLIAVIGAAIFLLLFSSLFTS
ncbi:MAG TPA: hypothetical protein GX525_06840 [Bacilli bacterium]|nr:hypothetical protein [Bacilli bacterium]